MSELENHIINLKHADPNVRRNAAWTIGRSRDIRILEPLIAALNDPDESVRVRVAESLGNLRDERAIQPLMTALETEQTAEVRAMLVASLGRQGDAQALELLIAVLEDEVLMVRSAAAEALSAMADARAVMPLVHSFLNDADTRYYTARSLMQLGGAATVDALTTALTFTVDSDIKIQIAEILGQLHDTRAIPKLELLLNDPDSAVAETAKWALRQLGVG